jgi:hypothetical protein
LKRLYHGFGGNNGITSYFQATSLDLSRLNSRVSLFYWYYVFLEDEPIEW